MTRHLSESRVVRRIVAALVGFCAGLAWAQSPPPYVYSSKMLPMLLLMPENSWLPANANLYSNVWTPDELLPLDRGVTHTPSKIILAWSGFGWDSNRGDLILFGGGHANYSGNDVYRWHSSDLLWRRASLPSEIITVPILGEIAIDGVDNAPISSHTYDNNLFLPVADRFITFGGAAYNNGGPFTRLLESNPTQSRLTGPYLFDPNRADGNNVGGSTGSHVKRVAPHPEIVGGQMWQNRDIHYWLASQGLPGTHVQGCTGYATEGGVDVVYVASANRSSTNLNLYRYQLTDLATPGADQITKIGAYAVGVSGQTSCGYDSVRKLFLRTGNNTIPFQFWDLTTAGPGNPDQSVQVNASIAALQSWLSANGDNIQDCGLEYDPARGKFVLWCGAGGIWEVAPPAGGNTPVGWTATQRPVPPQPAPPGNTGTGVLGKWRYAPYFDMFVGLQDINDGDIWIYKPVGWVQPNPPGNTLPTVSVTSPAPGTTVAPATPVILTANASDPGGSIARVEYYVNGTLAGSATSAPYTVSIAPVFVGNYSIVAIAVDNVGGMKASAPVILTVNAALTTTVLQRDLSGYVGASDTYLDRYASTNARGGSATLFLDPANYRPLIRFAIFQAEGGPVPNGAAIQSATLTLHKGSYYNDTLRLNALLKPWVEAQATWLNASAGVSWTVSGAAGAGSDYDASTDALVTPTWDPGLVNFDVTARVQQWATGGGNHGWRMAQTTSGGNPKWFAASEYTTNTTLRPKLTVVHSGGTSNVPPTVSITSPAAGATITLGQSFTLSANAGDSDGTVSKVEFYANGALVGTDLSAPYSVTWSPVTVGPYALAAVATDNGLATTTSAPVNVTVSPSVNVPPTVSMTGPTAGATITLGQSFTLSANAGDSDGTVSKVEFYANGALVGTDLSAPYSVTWTPAAVGPYALTAVATDNALAPTTSAAVNVTVNPVVTGTTVVLQRGLNGYAGASDTYLDRYASASARGGSATLFLDPANYRPLIRFAIFQAEGGPVPNGAAIQSATLTLHKGSYYNDTLRLNALLKPWVEAQATWLNASAGVSWTVSGAAGAGSDYDASTDALVTPTWDPGLVNFDVTARVQQWATGGGNHGWRMAQTTSGGNPKWFAASEYTTNTTLRPKLTVVHSGGTSNVPPTVSITSPAAGATITLGQSFTLSANAGDSDGTVSKVEFYANGALVGTDLSAPYSVTWSPVTVGPYALAAVATDNGLATTTSAPVNVTVSPSVNVPPTVSMTGPTAGATITLGQSFTLSANAGDSDGTVSKVEFYANGALVGTDLSAPYSVTWTPAAVGPYALTAVATDNALAPTTSAAVNVTVNPVVTGTTVVLQRGLNGYAGASDTYLDAYLSTNVRGGLTTFMLDPANYNPLIRFAIFQAEGGPVPNGAVIQSATLTLNKASYYNDTLRLNALLKPWVEAQATWLNARAGVLWTVSGAGGAGSDYNASADALVTPNWNPGLVNFDVTSRVQQWSGSGGNHGWRMAQTTSGGNPKSFTASESTADTALRPKLTITYQ